ncbi:MAG: hypothetical protein ACM34C_04050, partial [Syntrophaceae bacterium]
MKRRTTAGTRRQCLVLLFFMLISVTIAGCGYRFSPGGEWIDKSLQTVFVDNIANTTSEPFVEIYLRNGLEDQFRKSSRFRLTASKDAADL